MATGLWEVRLVDLPLPSLVCESLTERMGVWKAWHAAALCDRCLVFGTRHIGRYRLAQIRAVLDACGFPRAPTKCARYPWMPMEHRCRGQCEQDLRVCRRMLEQGDWSCLPA